MAILLNILLNLRERGLLLVSEWQAPGSEKGGAWNILCGNNAAKM